MFDLKPRLLVIDDDAQLRRLYARVLRHDFTVETEADAKRALRRIVDGPGFDVILCDRNLADGMSGQDFFESLSLDLQGRVVMCSGAEPEVHDAFAAARGDRYVMKLGHIAALISILLRVARVSAWAAA